MNEKRRWRCNQGGGGLVVAVAIRAMLSSTSAAVLSSVEHRQHTLLICLRSVPQPNFEAAIDCVPRKMLFGCRSFDQFFIFVFVRFVDVKLIGSFISHPMLCEFIV